MSYIEQGVYWYIKNVVFGGIRTLFSRGYVFFTVLSIAVALLAIFNPSMQRLEAITALSLILGAWQPIVFPLAFVVLLLVPGIGANTWFFIPLWALFTALIALLVPRDLVDSWGGYAIFFGNQKGHVPFSFIFNLVFIGGIIFSVLIPTYHSFVFLIISLIMLYMVNIFSKKGRNDRFAFTLSVFYISIFYYFATLNSPVSNSGLGIIDVLIALFTLFFAVQGNTRILESKVAPHAAVFLTLGLALGFHSAGLASIHLYQFIFASVIFPIALIMFISSDRFQDYFTRQPSFTKSLLDFGRNKLEGFLKKLIP